MKRILSRLWAFAMVAVIGLTGCSGDGLSADGLTGVYRTDTIAVIESLRTAVNMTKEDPNLGEAQMDARDKINAFAARYRRGAPASLGSFTTMRTALNALAGHYSSYPNRPVPEKLKNRLEQEFKQVEMALRREA